MSSHRSTACLALALALVASLPGRAHAEESTSPLSIEGACGRQSPAFQNIHAALGVGEGDPLPRAAVPIDARPWLFARCERPTEAVDCVLEGASDTLAVGVHGLQEACVARERDHLIRLLPERPLQPDTTYTLSCVSTPLSASWLDGSAELRPVDGLTLTTRASADRSRPPPDLAFVHAHLRRRDDTCCGDDPLYLEVEYPEDPELDTFRGEGGTLEVLYDGDTWLVVDGSDNHLPWGSGGLVVTAVATDGTRGPRLVIPEEAIDEERIYIPCRIAAGGGGLALWLLAPLLGLRLATRRRRRRQEVRR